MEFCLVKLLDGIFLSNSAVLTDYRFISDNKISHIVSWLTSFNMQGSDLHHQEDLSQSNFYNFQTQHQAISQLKLLGIQVTLLNRQNIYPTQSEIRQCSKSIGYSEQQCLCCLIVADSLLDGVWLIIPYLSLKFGWDLQTSLTLIRKKLKNSGFAQLQSLCQQLTKGLEGCYCNQSKKTIAASCTVSGNTIEKEEQQRCEMVVDLKKHQQLSEIEFVQMKQSNISEQQIDLSKADKYIDWENNEVLHKYQTQNIAELIIINTVKNINLSKSPHKAKNKIQSKITSKRKIRWADQISSQKLFQNKRINTGFRKSHSSANLNYNSHGWTLLAEKIKNNGSNLKPLLKNYISADQQQSYGLQKRYESSSDQKIIQNNYTTNFSVANTSDWPKNVSKQIQRRNISAAKKRNIPNKPKDIREISMQQCSKLNQNICFSVFDDLDHRILKQSKLRIQSKTAGQSRSSLVRGYTNKAKRQSKYTHKKSLTMSKKSENWSLQNSHFPQSRQTILADNEFKDNFFETILGKNLKNYNTMPLNSLKNWNNFQKETQI